MIENVHIQHFKSIKDLRFDPTRVNVFIGDTNSGKTNILEALTLLGRGVIGHELDKRLVRHEKPQDLFPMHDLSEPVVVELGDLRVRIIYSAKGYEFSYAERPKGKKQWVQIASADMDAFGRVSQFGGKNFDTRIRRFEYSSEVQFGPNASKELEPPYGTNLPGLLATNKALRTRLANILKQKGLRLEINSSENTIRLTMESEDNVVVPLPYRSMSDTIKRYLFLYSIIETHKGYSLVLDEPEQNAFPFYIKHMAEIMAMDKENQYFITTHDEVFLRSLIEKTPAKELSVFIAHTSSEGNTRLKHLSGAELSKLLDMDIYFNLDRFIAA